MFYINRYLYVDKKTHSKHEILARKVEFADELARRITALGVFNLRRARFGFIKVMTTDIPPYEIEMEQIDTIEEWEEKKNNRCDE